MPTSKEIAYENALKQIETAAKEYRNLWKREICESVKIEEYGLNEFFGGKAEGFEEALEILKERMSKS
ncbi:MAG TPA: hypothetical protein CFH84_11420 [Sulfurimonas sp. UBA12504]|nr:MAG: hypothetical protein A2019_04030 [Sulfurimonas sp. GWF2_37_8]DAB29089.1 MAG TPA: hypothetical protein CFH84_11420 [Sulfurimonas sp. UBA12504]